MVLQEIVSVSDSVGSKGQQKERRLSPIEMVNPAPLIPPYQPPVPYPQRLAWTKLLQLEPKYARFLDVMKRVMRILFSWKLSRKHLSACNLCEIFFLRRVNMREDQ